MEKNNLLLKKKRKNLMNVKKGKKNQIDIKETKPEKNIDIQKKQEMKLKKIS